MSANVVTESEMLFPYKAKRRYSQFSTASLIYGTVRLFISNKVEIMLIKLIIKEAMSQQESS